MTGIASKSQLRMSFLRYALVTVPLVLLLGILSGRASNAGYGNAWFDALAKPAAMPPGWAFGLAWPLLYVLLGLALAMILHARGATGRKLALGFFLAQLLLNLAWSPAFFALHEVRAAMVILVAMLALSIATIFLFARIRKGAAWLMLPYMAWLGYAAMLNYRIIELNPGAEALVPPAAGADILL
ncbi:MAG TPA: TspO/MBR family protein [Allosphingosinicella sp.]|nr:TspO/MBR family protein [Allosphingosinicella sp.]